MLIEWITGAAIVVQAMYAAATFHLDRKREASARSKPVIIIAVLMLSTWVAVGLDYWDRHQTDRYPSLQSIADGWGVAGQPKISNGMYDETPVYRVIVQTSRLSDYKDSYKLMMIARLEIPNVDPMADTKIEKSALYTITGAQTTLAIIGTEKLPYAVNQDNLVSFYVALIPSNFSPDQVMQLADVEKLGGVILGNVESNVTASPPTAIPHSNAAPKPHSHRRQSVTAFHGAAASSPSIGATPAQTQQP